MAGNSFSYPCLTSPALRAGSDGWRLYEYITRHFIATVSYDCKYLQTTIAFQIGTEGFSCTGKTLLSAGVCTQRHFLACLDGSSAGACIFFTYNKLLYGVDSNMAFFFPPGFTEVMPWQGIALEEALPSCEKGDAFTVDEIRLLEKQTSPPDYLTEAELITLMEKHGIGEKTGSRYSV